MNSTPAFLAVDLMFTPTASPENLAFVGFAQVALFSVHFLHRWQ